MSSDDPSIRSEKFNTHTKKGGYVVNKHETIKKREKGKRRKKGDQPLIMINLLLILLLLLVHSGLSNAVQVTLAALRDPSATLLLIDLDDTNLLECLEHLAVDLARGVDVVRWPGAAVLGGAVHLAEATDTDGLAEVDVTGDGSGANVEPNEQKKNTQVRKIKYLCRK